VVKALKTMELRTSELTVVVGNNEAGDGQWARIAMQVAGG
jgi:hypothetical protein